MTKIDCLESNMKPDLLKTIKRHVGSSSHFLRAARTISWWLCL